MSQPSTTSPTEAPCQPTSHSAENGPRTGPYVGGMAQASAALTPPAERNWAMAAHLSGFAAAYVALGFLGPLVVLLAAGDRSPFVRRHAVEALNFNLSWLLYILGASILSIVLIGLPILLALAIGYLVLVLLAGVEASRGNEYRYPLTLRLVS